MATMNISLPDAMKDWVEQQAATGRYSNSSDVVRDLIRREQVRAEKIANMQRLIDEGRASGVSERSPEERRIEARRRARLIVAADGI
nr:type II toxin-antitoxin system ParD family antitoxin [Sphingomonas endophytica]